MVQFRSKRFQWEQEIKQAVLFLGHSFPKRNKKNGVKRDGKNKGSAFALFRFFRRIRLFNVV